MKGFIFGIKAELFRVCDKLLHSASLNIFLACLLDQIPFSKLFFMKKPAAATLGFLFH